MDYALAERGLMLKVNHLIQVEAKKGSFSRLLESLPAAPGS